MVKHLGLCILAVALALVLPAHDSRANEYLTGSVGYYDLIDKDDTAVTGGLEYRFNPWIWRLRPIIGGFITTDKAAYGYGGFNLDIPVIANQLYVIPNLAVGAYRNGDGKDLGGALEFRSGIELAYQRPNYDRIGVAFNHISNASQYTKNPGVETLLINYSIPTGKLWGSSN